MTTNKPEIAGYRWKTNIPDAIGGGYAYSYASHWSTGPREAENLILLSDYEARMAVLFDGYAVYSAMTEKAKQHTSPESVAAVLDAVVKLMREVSDDNQ